MFRYLLPFALAVVVAVLVGGVPAASASTTAGSHHLRLPKSLPSGKPKLPRMPRSTKPTVRAPRHGLLARTSDTTFTLGGGLGVLGYVRGCDSVFWWSAISRYAYDCWVETWSSGEWYQTDRDFYYWTGSRWAYYGHYRCSKVQSVDNVVIVGPTPDHTTRCGWV